MECRPDSAEMIEKRYRLSAAVVKPKSRRMGREPAIFGRASPAPPKCRLKIRIHGVDRIDYVVVHGGKPAFNVFGDAGQRAQETGHGKKKSS
jgi:hypothetical protein